MTTSTIHPIQKHRAARGWSRPRLARESGVTEMTVFRIEHGHNTPSIGTLMKIAAAFGVPMDALTVANLPEGSGTAPEGS